MRDAVRLCTFFCMNEQVLLHSSNPTCHMSVHEIGQLSNQRPVPYLIDSARVRGWCALVVQSDIVADVSTT